MIVPSKFLPPIISACFIIFCIGIQAKAQSVGQVGTVYSLSGTIQLLQSPEAKSGLNTEIENGEKVMVRELRDSWARFYTVHNQAGWVYLPSLFFSQEHDFIKRGTCELIVAARKTLPEVLDFIQTISSKKFVNVFAATNGWYAISVGALKPAEVEPVLKSWKTSGRIPQDSYCSPGDKFVAEINWQELQKTAQFMAPTAVAPSAPAIEAEQSSPDLKAPIRSTEVKPQAPTQGKIAKEAVGFEATSDEGTFQMPGFVAAINAAVTTADYAELVGDPIILIGAAKIIKSIASSEHSGEIGKAALPDLGKDTPIVEEQNELRTNPENRDLVSEYLAKARDLAGRDDDEELLFLADKIENSSSPGLVDTYKIQVPHRAARTITTQFFANEVAEVGLFGDGNTDLDLQVLDESGNLICQSVSMKDHEFCRWTPSQSAAFKILIANQGSMHNDAIVYIQ